MARPQQSPATHRKPAVSVRLNAVEQAELAAKIEQSGLSKSAYIRNAVLGQPITVVKSTMPDFITRHDLRRMGNNLNQIARAMNSGNLTPPDELAEVLAKLDKLFDRWLAHDSKGR